MSEGTVSMNHKSPGDLLDEAYERGRAEGDAGDEYLRAFLSAAEPMASGYMRVHGVVFHLNEVLRWARGER